MSTRIGKIGRLSKERRNELGQRIEDGEPGTEIVHWLNGLPDVRKVLQAHFAGRPISEQNLSDWKQGGHAEWLRREEAREAVQEARLSDRFATVFSAEMTRLAMALLEEESDPEKKWKRLCEIHRELSRLRRDDHRAARTAIWQERWDWEVAREELAEAQREKEARKERLTNMLLEGGDREVVAMTFGGGEYGRKQAELLYRLKCDLPLDDVLDGTWAKKVAAAREKSGSQAGTGKAPEKAGKSGLIKPNKGEKTADATKHKGTKCKSERRRTEAKCNTRAGRPRSDRHGAVPLPPAETHVPDPEREAYNRWFRMNRGAEPFDQEALKKLYEAMPPT